MAVGKNKVLKKKARVLGKAAKTTAKNTATRNAKRVSTATKAVKKANRKPTVVNKLKAKSAVKHARGGTRRKKKL
jgi:hypothetical protein